MATIKTIGEHVYMPIQYYEDRVEMGHIIAIDFDGRSILDAAEEYLGYTAQELKSIILNEGGVIDEDGTIHKGSAKYDVCTNTKGTYMDLDSKQHRVHVARLRLPFAEALGRKYKGKTLMEAMFSDEMKQYPKVTRKDLVMKLAKYGFFVNKDGIINLVQDRRPTEYEDAMGAFKKIVE